MVNVTIRQANGVTRRYERSVSVADMCEAYGDPELCWYIVVSRANYFVAISAQNTMIIVEDAFGDSLDVLERKHEEFKRLLG